MTDRKPWSNLVSREEVLRIHARGLKEYGGDGDSTELESGCVDGSLGAAWSAEKYHEPEESVSGLIFAGYVIFHLAVKHCFLDGNKRVAWAVGMQVLGRLGLSVDATEQESYKMILELLQDKEPQVMVSWLADRIAAI